MNTRKFTSVIAVSTIIPLAAWAQSTPSGSSNDPRSDPSSSYGTSSSTSGSKDKTSTYSGTGMDAHASIVRVTEEQLENRATASSLIGKEVVDREGNEVGTVKDIELAAVLPQGLHSTAGSNEYSSDMDRSSTSATAGSSMNSSSTGTTAAAADTASREVSVFIEVGGFMGVGSDLVAIPASQLRRDASDEDRIQINVSRQELQAIVSPQTARVSGQ